MIKKKNVFLVMIFLLYIPLSSSAMYKYDDIATMSPFQQAMYGAVGLCSVGMLAACLFGLKNDCEELVRGCLSSEEGRIEVSSKNGQQFMEVDIKRAAKGVALRCVFIIASVAICYYCSLSATK